MKTLIVVTTIAMLAIPTTKAAVLVTTGTTLDGKAYISVPTITFEINRTAEASGFNAVTFDFVNVWNTAGPSILASGSGLTFSDSSQPGSYNVTGWYNQAAAWNAFSDRDSILIAPPDTAHTYTIGDIITFHGGTFTLTSADPSFSIFPSGSYEVYFVGLGVNGGPLSSAGVAVPEPSVVALLGITGLGLITRRRRH